MRRWSGELSAAWCWVGYLYDVRLLYQVGEFVSISLSAAILLSAIGAGILCARPENGFMAILASEDLGGVMLRRLLPFAFGLPTLAGWIRITAQRSGHYRFNFGVAVAVATVILIVLSVLWVLAGTLNRTTSKKASASDSAGAGSSSSPGVEGRSHGTFH